MSGGPGDHVTFEAFPKIGRLRRDMIVTEKLDGTNAQVIVTEKGTVAAGSRKRLLGMSWHDAEDKMLDTDNFGFCAWVFEHADELIKLGPGRHFGEWWGFGIQRGYGLAERRFSLFNVNRWQSDTSGRPACCGVVPVLYRGIFESSAVDAAMSTLAMTGSVAAPGFMKPEGVVVYHTQTNSMFKKTFEMDGTGKERAA